MYVEITGAILAVIYLLLEIKQNWLMWVVGIVSSIFYIYIFFEAALYAEMGLNVYYALMSVYGIYCWKLLKSKTEKGLLIRHIKKQELVWLMLVSAIIFATIQHLLKSYTDSPVPYPDAAIAALSVTATWMTARKIIEHWYVWLITNAFSVMLYLHLELYPTAALFVVYTIMAFIGLKEWDKYLKNQN